MDFIAILFIIISIVLKILEAGKKDSKKITSERNDYTGSLEKMKPLLMKIKDEFSDALDLNDVISGKEKNSYAESKVKITEKPKTMKKVSQINIADTQYKKEEQNMVRNDSKPESLSRCETRTDEVTYDNELNLNFSEEELIKSVIMCEILNKPVSKRGAI